MLKQRHQLAIFNGLLLFIGILNLFFWYMTSITVLIVLLLFLSNYSLQAKNRSFLSQLQMYEESSARILKTEELNDIPPIMTEDGELAGVEFNKLMRALQRQYNVNQSNSQIISSVSRVIEAPLVILNSSGKIDYANQSFKQWHEGGRDIRKVRNKALRHVLQDALLREVPLKEELEVHKNYYIAASNPIRDDHDSVVGIVVLFHDVTELKSYQHLQREFFGNASHELKTPISAIKGCTEILLNGEHNQEIYNEFLTIIQDENLRLERLVQDLLLINRYEFHQIQLQKESVLLNDLLTDCIIQVLNIATLKKQKIHLDAPDPIYFEGDFTKLQQCFLNLLTNAVHYSGEGSVIKVKLELTSSGKIRILFKDNGIGIPAVDLPHIFERFYRVDKARARYTGGSGLGLPIVLSIVEAHGGTIFVNSVLDEGTTFTILLS